MTDDVRGFPAFGAQPGRGPFARSWWGRAWISAMEDTALDLRQLKQGRKYATAGLVGPIAVGPGRIAAQVDDVDGGPYQTRLRLAELSDVDWERFLDRVASRAGHLAALLDRDMPHDLVEAADDAGVHLLPGIGDLDPECDCPGWELPCRHAAALSFQVSWLLDADPFVLLLIRGKGEREVLEELQRRNAPRFVRATGADEDVPVSDAFARTAPVMPDLDAFTPRGRPEVPAAPGIPAETFAVLADNAAAVAEAMLSGAPKLNRRQDAVRLAATFPGTEAAARLREDAGEDFARAVAAWTYGGRGGLDVLESTWSPPKPVLARARAALAEAVEDRGVVLEFDRNRGTVAGTDVQLRAGRDGRWYPYRAEAGVWWPSGSPETDPGVAFAALLA
ncbi:SWIM zinc finger family protein [Amycolatopsis sp. NPDC059027]|uniref:SWIM zinc finger family protein n=1 Tax=unclassified Amycolatopsis TaxID=2618356 RepID=UPI00366D976D